MCIGVYAGLDDFWLEHLSGHFEFTCTPSRQQPTITLILTGNKHATSGEDNLSNGTDRNGISLRVKADAFKLAGDKGKNVPKFTFDSIKVTVCVRILITIIFDTKTSKWTTNSKGFKIELLSFRGPYGINKSMVSATLAVIIPSIRNKIVSGLPKEFGMMLRTLPSPISIVGDFDIRGVELTDMTNPFDQIGLNMFPSAGESNSSSGSSGSSNRRYLHYTNEQLDMFKYFQRSIDRSRLLKSLEDVIIYRKKCRNSPSEWDLLKELWYRGMRIYTDKVYELKKSMAQSQSQAQGKNSSGSGDSEDGMNVPMASNANADTGIAGKSSLPPTAPTGSNTNPAASKRASISNTFSSMFSNISGNSSNSNNNNNNNSANMASTAAVSNASPSVKARSNSVLSNTSTGSTGANSNKESPPIKTASTTSGAGAGEGGKTVILFEDILAASDVVMGKPIQVNFTLDVSILCMGTRDYGVLMECYYVCL